MASRNVMVAVVAMLIAAAVLPQKTSADDEVVGGTTGWGIPPNGTFYAEWAARQSFEVGDILVFNFTTGGHDVAKVTRAAFDGCITTSPIFHQTNGPANVTLNTTGEHYFICTFPTHCSRGQKLAITIGSNTPPSPSGTTVTPPPPPPSSAPAASISAFSLLFVSFVIAFVC